jgi:hypothetical protein
MFFYFFAVTDKNLQPLLLLGTCHYVLSIYLSCYFTVLDQPLTIIRFLSQAFNRWGYYPLILIGSWSFATINRLYDFANPGHKIFWLSILDIGLAGLMVSLWNLLSSIPG